MFQQLTEKLKSNLQPFKGHKILSESSIDAALKEVRISLLDADVPISVIKPFLEGVKEETVGQQVQKNADVGEYILGILHKKLVELLGSDQARLNLKKSPTVILLAGLQGAGKTTTAAKLGYWLKNKERKSVLLVSVDVYRPAAIEQLNTLCQQNDLSFFSAKESDDPLTIAKNALRQTKNQMMDVLIVDTAGRLHIDDSMMEEIKTLSSVLAPKETLFVVDAMMGQDSVSSAKAFDDALALTGIVLSKVDGDARGGAALATNSVTKKPIKFMGVGEAVSAFEIFYPDRIASRILGMGDMKTLVEEAAQNVDQRKAKKLVSKFTKGEAFDLNDLLNQLQAVSKMGGIAKMVDKLPALPSTVSPDQLDDKRFIMIKAVISSMTMKERKEPSCINGSRKQRIAKGSGTSIQDVNHVLKQHRQMSKMFNKFSKKKGMMKKFMGSGMGKSFMR